MINLKWKYFKTVVRYLKPYTWFVLFAFIFMLGNQFCSLYIPNLMSKIVDIGIKQHGFENPGMINSALNQEEIIKKTEALFSDKDAENLNIAIIIKDKNLLKIFKRKK